ncbi:MAG TPA: hypothetical protein VNA25_05095 [Phycisphaerae bacterium]|nr:hypothetical protein [Phycisphaerae bacterium]
MNDEQRDSLLTDLRLNLLGFSKDLGSKTDSDEKDFKAIYSELGAARTERKALRDRLKELENWHKEVSWAGSFRASSAKKWITIITVGTGVVGGICSGVFALLKWALEG